MLALRINDFWRWRMCGPFCFVGDNHIRPWKTRSCKSLFRAHPHDYRTSRYRIFYLFRYTLISHNFFSEVTDSLA